MAERDMHCLRSLLGKPGEEQLPVGGRGRTREARPQAARRVRHQCELRHGEQLAADVLQREVHLALRVRKDAVGEHAFGQALRLGFAVAALHADQSKNAAADRRDLGAIDRYLGV